MLQSFLVLIAVAGWAACYATNQKNPFSSANWPLPHNITGDSLTATGQWGGVHVHDPSVIKGPDGYYYSFSTHNLIAISQAPSLDGYWKVLGSVLVNQSVIPLPGRNDTWAPDVVKVGDTYHCYYSVSTFGSQDSGIGLATSKTLLPGTWTDHGLVLESCANKPFPLNVTNAIDPAFFHDPNTGEDLLNYGSFWTDNWQFQLTADLKNISWKSPPVHLSYDPAGSNPEEGSFMSDHDGWYYVSNLVFCEPVSVVGLQACSYGSRTVYVAAITFPPFPYQDKSKLPSRSHNLGLLITSVLDIQSVLAERNRVTVRSSI
jgi:arabinan endo-1,5-alpha-L-arabinosidase